MDRPDVALDILNTNSMECIQAPTVYLKSEIKDESVELYDKELSKLNSSQKISLRNQSCPHCNGQFKLQTKKDERSFSLHTEQCSKCPTTQPCPYCNEIFKTGDNKDNTSFIQHKMECSGQFKKQNKKDNWSFSLHTEQ